MKKKVEQFIMKRYNQGAERIEIIKELARENNLKYTEAQPIVEHTILQAKHMDNRLGGAFD